MNVINIYRSHPELENHTDHRGSINDVIYNKNINHVAIIESHALVERGNHFHKETTQHILILEGSLTYYYKEPNNSEIKKYEIFVGDIVSTPPYEIHALKIGPNGCKFLVFSEGKRGGKDYESDTYRTDSIIK